jgi:3-oxoadipate enol-lactonase
MTRMQIGAREVNFRLTGPEGAPTIVFAHPLGVDLSVWDAVRAKLGDSFQCLCFDARGHGGSWKPPGPYKFDDFGADCLALLDALAIERAHFCGLSMGGVTGQWLLVHAPERLERVVLANTAAYLPDASAWNARIEAVGKGGVAALTPTILPRWLSDPFRASHPETVKRVTGLLNACDPAGYAACCAALRDADFRADLPKVKKDILVIVGEADGSTPPAMGEALAQSRGAKLARLNVAHLSCVEEPAGFADLLRAFLGAV